jgi:hypothetical protein
MSSVIVGIEGHDNLLLANLSWVNRVHAVIKWGCNVLAINQKELRAFADLPRRRRYTYPSVMSTSDDKKARLELPAEAYTMQTPQSSE